MPAHDPDRRDGPLVELGCALEILNLKELLDAFLRWEAVLELHGSDSRLNARRQFVWQWREFARLLRARESGKTDGSEQDAECRHLPIGRCHGIFLRLDSLQKDGTRGPMVDRL